MVSVQQSVILAVVVIIAFASSAYAISCFQCESGFNERCGEQFDAEGIHKADCSRVPVPRFLQSLWPGKNATGCMKIVNEVSGVRHIVRNCYFGDIKSTSTGCQSDPALPYVKQISCDVCADNLCNSATAAGPIAVTIAIFVAVAHLLY